MSTALENIAIGLVTSVVTGVCVWLWQRAQTTRRQRQEAAFFGIEQGRECLLVMNHNPRAQWTMSHSDIQALVEVAMLVRGLGAQTSIVSWDQVREGIGDRTEFCIGGPDSNGRTRGHLMSYVPGVTMRPYHAQRDRLALAVGGQRFRLVSGEQEFAAVVKLTQRGMRPLFLICGQTAVTNWAAVKFLKSNCRTLTKTLESTDQFCIILRVTRPDVYGHGTVKIEADVSSVAFSAPKRRRRTGGDPG